jgi:hypothetical protein
MAATEPTELMSGARFVAQHLTAPERIERAIREIELNLKADPGVIFDHAKSLIETTCKTIFKEMGKTADEGWSVSQLASFTMQAVVRIPAGHPDPVNAKKRMENALRGLVAVVQGLGELRNLEGEIGHGQEADRIQLSPCQAEFAARCADTVIKFLVESHRNNQEADGIDTLSYYQHPEFNEYIDQLHPPVTIFQGQYNASEILFQFDLQIYKDVLNEFLEEAKGEPA